MSERRRPKPVDPLGIRYDLLPGGMVRVTTRWPSGRCTLELVPAEEVRRRIKGDC